MIPRSVNLAAITREDRHKMIDHTMKCINKCSAWIVNHTMYSNMAICINFQIEVGDVPKLIELLNTNGLNLTKETLELVNVFNDAINDKNKNKEMLGAINITFIHNEKDLKIIVPAVPG